MERKTSATKGGFTLIEVAIALGLLAFTLLGIFQMQFYAMRGNTLSLGATTALHMVQDRMETLLAEPFDSAMLVDAVPGNPIDSTAAPDFSQVVLDPKNEAFTLVTNVNNNLNPTGTVDSKTVCVMALWGPGNIRQCGVTSLVRRRGGA